jgi:DNA-binding CsgD family transcriptional regulator
LNVSIKTIEVHRVNIKEKLHTPTVSDLIRFAVRWTEAQSTASQE